MICAMSDRNIARVENYTNAFVISAFVLCFSSLLTLWAVLGYVPVLCLAALSYVALSASCAIR